MYCSKCGKQLNGGECFCSACGNKIEQGNNTFSNGASSNDMFNSNQTSRDEQEFDEDQRKVEYMGKVFKCPNCGNTINSSDISCPICGIRLSGKKANSLAMEFQQQLLAIEMSRPRRNIWLMPDATDQQIITFIKSYPVPNTIEDIVEFFHLALGNINVRVSKNSVWNSQAWAGVRTEREISNAWVVKLRQIYNKAELYFPDQPEFKQIKEAYTRIMKELNLD